MPTVNGVQLRIQKIEGFRVCFRDRRSGRNLPDHMRNVPHYPYERMAKNSWTVEGWKRLRFNKAYPGFNIDVLDKDGSTCNGHAKLATVRDTYLD